jgi:NTE family protein
MNQRDKPESCKISKRSCKKSRFACKTARLHFIVLLILMNAACARFGVDDKPLTEWTPDLRKAVFSQLEGHRSQELTVLLAFSGGGSRAAALAYGVLKELADIDIKTAKESRSLLHEVDVISSVSGGSFTATYYGLYGERIFTDFEQRFLRKNVESILFWRQFNPFNLVRLLSPSYGLADMAAEYYDKNLFDGATFADLQSPDTPLVLINATDLATGIRFSFNQEIFDVLCLDLKKYSLSRAVAASSAVPVLFTPITLKNNTGSCGYQPDGWYKTTLESEELTQKNNNASHFLDFLDLQKRPWLHLVDGGISDNLGMRAFYNSLTIAAEPGSFDHEMHHSDTRHLMIISVNANAQHKTNWVMEHAAPSLLEVIRSVTNDQMNRYNEDTIKIVRATFEQWVKKKSTPERPVTFHFVEVSFNKVRDDNERDFLNGIGTNFDLNDEQVNHLVAAAGQILRESEELKEFLKIAGESGAP